MKPAHHHKGNPVVPIMVTLVLVLTFLSAITLIVGKYRLVSRVSTSLARASCDTSFFTVSVPNGATFSTGCIGNNVQIYTDDNRYTFFHPSAVLNNQAFIQTPNREVKDRTSLSWDVEFSKPATIYLMVRHVPGVNQTPAWITGGGYVRQTTDELINTNQYLLRKSEQGVIGMYDIYSKDVPSGPEKFYAASDEKFTAYSMYLVAVVPRN